MAAPHTPPTRFAEDVDAMTHDTHKHTAASQDTAAYKQQPALFQQFKNARIAAAAGELHGRFSSSLLSLSQFDQFHREKDRAVSAEEQTRRAEQMAAAREDAQKRRLEQSVLKHRVEEETPSQLFAHTSQPPSRGSNQRTSAVTSLVASPVASSQRSRPDHSALSMASSHTLPASALSTAMHPPPSVGYAIQLSSAGTAILQHPPHMEEQPPQHDHSLQQQQQQTHQQQQPQQQQQQQQAEMAGLQWLQTRDQRLLEQQQQQQRQLEADAQSRAAAAAAAAAVAARVFGAPSSVPSATAPASHAEVVTHTRSRVRNLRSAMDSLGLDESTKRASGSVTQQASPEIAARSQLPTESRHLSKPIARRRSPLEPRSPPSRAPAAIAMSASQAAAPVVSARRPMSASQRAAERKAMDLPSHVARLLQIQSAHARRRGGASADSSEDSSDEGEAKAIRSVRRTSAPAPAVKSSVRVPASPSRAPALALRSFHASSKPRLSDDVADADLPLQRPRSSMDAARVPISQLAARAARADEDDAELDSTSGTLCHSRWTLPAPVASAAYEQLPRPSLAAGVQPLLPSSPIHVHIHPQQVPLQPPQAAQPTMPMPLLSQPVSSISSRASSPAQSNATSRLASRRSSVVSSSNFDALPVASNQPPSAASWPADSLAADDAAADAELSELGALLSADGEPGFDASLRSIAHAPLSSTLASSSSASSSAHPSAFIPTAAAASAHPSSFSYTAPLYLSKPASSFSGASTVVVPVARRATQAQQYMEFLRRQQGDQQHNGATTTRSVPAHSFFQPNNEATAATSVTSAALVPYAQPQPHAVPNGVELASELNPSVSPAAASEWSASLRSAPSSPSASSVAHPSHGHGLHSEHVNHLADTSLMSPARLAAYLRHYLAHRAAREEGQGAHSHHDDQRQARSMHHANDEALFWAALFSHTNEAR